MDPTTRLTTVSLSFGLSMFNPSWMDDPSLSLSEFDPLRQMIPPLAPSKTPPHFAFDRLAFGISVGVKEIFAVDVLVAVGTAELEGVVEGVGEDKVDGELLEESCLFCVEHEQKIDMLIKIVAAANVAFDLILLFSFCFSIFESSRFLVASVVNRKRRTFELTWGETATAQLRV